MSAATITLPSYFETPPAISRSASSTVFPSGIDRPESYVIDTAKAKSFNELASVCAATGNREWTTAGAKPVDETTFENAATFLKALPLGIIQPEISAHPDGEVEFEWFKSPDRVLTVSIGRSYINFAALRGAAAPVSGRTLFGGSIPASVAATPS